MAYIVEKDENLLSLRGLLLDARFRVERRLTRGSYSEIHLARNLSPQPGEPDIVIVKALNLWFQEEQDADLERTLIENIALEAQTLSDFQQENIVRLFSDGHALDQDGRQFYYLVLEYMPGGSINQHCRHHPLTFERTLSYMAQICAALSYAHARDVIHRDVKPSNIMLSADYRKVKVLDFGVARHQSNDNGLMTKVGTDVYAAPEHYSLSDVPGTKLTPAADVYGLAKTAYFMLCGKPPSKFRQQQITALPAPINAQPWAEECRRVLCKATASRPADRYQSIADFYLALQAISELTVHSARSKPEATFNPQHPHLRIVVDLPAKQTSGTGAKQWYELLVTSARAVARSSKSRLRERCERASPALRSCHIGLINLRQSVACHLRMLPLKLLLHIAVVVIICLILLVALPLLVKRWYPSSNTLPTVQAAKEAPAEKFVVAGTDINIRSAPSRTAPKVGLVERDSKARILRFNRDRKWCEIEVIQHGRGKENPSSADRGWVYVKALHR